MTYYLIITLIIIITVCYVSLSVCYFTVYLFIYCSFFWRLIIVMYCMYYHPEEGNNNSLTLTLTLTTVVVLCVCVCVHSYLPPHTLESQKRDTNGFYAIQGSF